MTKTPVLAAALTLGFLVTTPVAADDDTGLYIGGSINRLSADFADVNDVNFDDSDNALGAKIGYMFNNRFGVEAGYLDLGNYQARAENGGINLNLDSDGFYGVGVLNAELSDRWDFYGKLGVFIIDSNADFTDFEESSTELYGALGVQYDLGPIDVFGEFSKIDTDYQDLSIDIITLGINYQFPK